MPIYPGVSRDLSIIVDKTLPWSEIDREAREAGGEALESVSFLDTFEGPGVPEGRHSLHFGLTFRKADRTLTGNEVDASVRAIVEACAARFGAALRAS